MPPQQTVLQTVETPWPNPRYWWPEDPHLYVLQTELRPARPRRLRRHPALGLIDRRLDRFGFRELWIDGIAFVLNGTRVKIRSQWAGGAGSSGPTGGNTDPGQRLEGLWNWQMRSVHVRQRPARAHAPWPGCAKCAMSPTRPA